MNDDDRKQTEQLAELAVRRYFDHYLQNVLPVEMKEGRAHTHAQIAAHNQSPEAHGGVQDKVQKARWMAAGVIALASFLGSAAWATMKGWIAPAPAPVVNVAPPNASAAQDTPSSATN